MRAQDLIRISIRDGKVYEYEGGRTVPDFIEFAENGIAKKYWSTKNLRIVSFLPADPQTTFLSPVSFLSICIFCAF